MVSCTRFTCIDTDASVSLQHSCHSASTHLMPHSASIEVPGLVCAHGVQPFWQIRAGRT
jgi:hypothetical protein